MKFFKTALLLAVGGLFASCYNDFDNPAPQKVYTDAEVAEMGGEYRTIAQVKQMFLDQFNTLSNTGGNDNWDNTKFLQFEDDIYIKGKVISDDEEGNIYKSLYLQDETAAIEIKLTNGVYLNYRMTGEYDPVNRTPIASRWVYVRLKGLYLGNYRMMLSIGDLPTSSVNAVGTDKYYANSNIEDARKISEHVLPGEPTTLVFGEDIKIVTPENYTQLGEADFARLLSLEGVKCHYAGVQDQDGNTAVAMKSGSYDQIYPSWIDTSVRPGQDEYGNTPVVSKPWYKWAFSVDGTCLYGSICFRFNDAARYNSEKGVYMVRTSGYSRFASRNIVKNGAVGNILGIFAIYSKYSDYRGGSNDQATYQISVSRFSDLDFNDSDVLTDAQVATLTPDGWIDGVYHSGSDSYYVPSQGEGDDNDSVD